MRSIPALVVLAFLAAAILSGCSDTTGPGTGQRAALILDATVGDFEGEPVVRVEASALNASRRPIEHWSYGVGIGVEDSGGNQLIMHDPSIVYVAPPQPVTLEPRGSVATALDLVWAYEPDGTAYRVPAGSYTVRAVFTYWWEGHPDHEYLVQEIAVVVD